MFTRILIATDGSDAATAAVFAGGGLARALSLDYSRSRVRGGIGR